MVYLILCVLDVTDYKWSQVCFNIFISHFWGVLFQVTHFLIELFVFLLDT